MSNMIKIGEVIFDLDVPIYGAKTIGVVINQSERQTYHLLEAGHLPATKVGVRKWASTPRRLLRPIIGDDGIAALIAAAHASGAA